MSKTTLRKIVQALRDKARETLRMKAINSLLQELFYANKNLSQNEEKLSKIDTDTLRQTYKISKLDEADPEFGNKIEKANKKLEEIKKTEIANEKLYESEIEKYTKEIKTIEEKISEYENGKTKISIDTINDLADKLISNQ